MVSLTEEITICNNMFLVAQSNFVAAIVSYLHLFNTHPIKKQLCIHSSYFQPVNESCMNGNSIPDFCALLLLKRLGLGDNNQLLKKTRKGPQERTITQLFFLCYQLNCQNGLTFTTIRCCLQLNSTHLNFSYEKKFECDELCSRQMQVSK